jgi:hypothetical protein
MKFRILRDPTTGMWSAWPVLGGNIIGPVAVLDTLYHLMTQRCPTFTAEISHP